MNQTAFDRYNRLYNNNLYRKLQIMVNEALPIHLIGQDRFYAHNQMMNQITDSALYMCGETFYTQATMINLLSDAYMLNPDLAQAIDSYLTIYKG